MRSGETVLGGVAQLGERLPCTQEVVGSIPITSTILHGGQNDTAIGSGKQNLPYSGFLEVSIYRIMYLPSRQNVL